MGRPPLVSREEIIAAARDVFVKEGLAASIRDVAAVAGISEAAIFKRFSTKAALIVAAMAPPPPDIPRLLAPLDSADLRTGLAETMENIVGYFRELLPLTLPIVIPARCRALRLCRRARQQPRQRLWVRPSPHDWPSLVNAGRLRRLQPFAIAGIVARHRAQPRAVRDHGHPRRAQSARSDPPTWSTPSGSASRPSCFRLSIFTRMPTASPAGDFAHPKETST